MIILIGRFLGLVGGWRSMKLKLVGVGKISWMGIRINFIFADQNKDKYSRGDVKIFF